MFRLSGRARLGVLLLAAAFLSGCATIKRQAFNAAAAGHVKTIVIAQAENQSEYTAFVLGHPGMSFGLIGGLVAAADMQMKTNKLTAAINPKEARLQERFTERLTAKLAQAGYETVHVVLPKDTKPEQAAAIAKQSKPGDAVLVVALNGAYWAAGPTSDYFPRLIAQVRKVDVKTDKLLYEDTITYGYAQPQLESVHLASEPTYRFANIDVLVADPVKTRQGLYAGLDAVADQIVRDLKK